MARTNSSSKWATLLAMLVGLLAAILAAFGIASAATGSQGDAPKNEVSQYGVNQ